MIINSQLASSAMYLKDFALGQNDVCSAIKKQNN